MTIVATNVFAMAVGTGVAAKTLGEFAAQLRDDFTAWGQAVKMSGAKLE